MDLSPTTARKGIVPTTVRLEEDPEAQMGAAALANTDVNPVTPRAEDPANPYLDLRPIETVR